MKSLFTIALLAYSAIGVEHTEKEIRDVLADCADGHYESCAEVEAKRAGKADNTWCATFSPRESIDRFNQLCELTEGCHKEGNIVPKSCKEVRRLTKLEFDNFLGHLPDDIKISESPKREVIMNPHFGWFACQALTQLHYSPEGESYIGANMYMSYETKTGLRGCSFYACDDEAMAQVEKVLKGEVDPSVEWHNGGDIDVVLHSGPSYCV